MQDENKKHYVDNSKLLSHFVQWKSTNCEMSEIPEYVTYSVMQIASKLATHASFRGYTYNEDMIMDGVETCIRYMHNFDPEKNKNPFSYLTQITYNAFLHRIAKEKKQHEIQEKLLSRKV